RNAQADPVLGILGAIGDLPPGWRGLAQLILRPAPDDWCQGYLRLAVEHPLAAERTGGPSLTGVLLLAGLLVAGTLAFQGLQWYRGADWLHLALLIGSLVTGGPGVIWLGRRLTRRPIYDMGLVQEKVSRIAYLTLIRLAVFAPAAVPAGEVEARLQRLAAAYRQFNLASGNGLRSCRLTLRGRDLRWLGPLLPLRATPILNTRELAGLWHLPQAQADVPLLERTSARRRLPLPDRVQRGCRIGFSAHQGRTVPVALPDELLRRHLLLVAKTRRGKSSLLLQIAQDRMLARLSNGRPPALVLVDPHHDLAQAALGLVPPDRREDVVFLDVAERNRPFGLNLLDTGLFADRDKAVANALAIFRRQFDRFWGPRMEDAFRFALLTLYEVNQAVCGLDPAGRDRQHTILDVPALLVNPAFRRGLLGLVTDPVITAWWSGYFDPLDRRLQLEIANPVQTKVQRFAGSRAARSIVGQPCSTVDPAAWLRTGTIVIINTAKGTVGEDTAALIGATLLNLIALAIGERARLDPRQRHPVTLIVDEFHTMPGADYEAILAELAKYGANLVLATQTLATLDTHDGEQQRALRATVFANLDGLFAFHTSAEDARYLVPELGGEVDEPDLIALGEHQCYVKLSASGERLPTFSVRLDPPPATDPAVAARLAAVSAARYGRDAMAVERDLQLALAEIEASQRRAAEGSGVSADPDTEVQTAVPTSAQKQRDRTHNRRTKSSDKQARSSAPLPTQATPATQSKGSPRQLALAEAEPDREEVAEP
ncbi:type IV secretory system conjugative DNA transfer family protein, partial [Nitrolancea hollandica]|uniref:type IV secretory system conjugative DNA transfer family protein n=1 Tax=Nitrolancea hollandica TaxID=1206749 RepID=UPI001266EEB3